MAIVRSETAISNMTSGHRGIKQGSAFCWLYKAWAEGNEERGIVRLPDDATVVEVGCGPLHSLGYLCDVAPPTWNIISVDPYYEGNAFADFCRVATENLGDVINRVKFLRWPSPQVCSLFEDESVDAVLIDGDHSYHGVLADIAGWMHKVKPGGYIAGDDVDPDFPGAEQAFVDMFGDLQCWGSTAVVRR